ncbi:hypothetical protein H4R35_000653 [Dimargaris xerosporica]|nr:hypothetical protein H4R35_000653 [Dimargaris xerosporica]
MPASRTAAAAQPKTTYKPRATRTRAPKRVERYDDTTTATSESAPAVSGRGSHGQHGAPKGHGVALRTFPEFAALVADSAAHSDLLHALHRVLYNRPGSQRDLKTNLRAYHGVALDDLASVDLDVWYDWDALRSQEESQGTHSHTECSPIVAGNDYQKMHAKLAKWTMVQLRQLSHSVNIPPLKTKHQLVDGLTRFLMKPGKANTVARPQKRATKPSSTKGKKVTTTTKAKPKAQATQEKAAPAEAPTARKRKRSADSSEGADTKKAKKQPSRAPRAPTPEPPKPQPRAGRKARAVNQTLSPTGGAKATKGQQEEKITTPAEASGHHSGTEQSPDLSPTKPAISVADAAEPVEEEKRADRPSQLGGSEADPQHLEGKMFSPYLPEETAGASSALDGAPTATAESPSLVEKTGTPVLSTGVESVEDEEAMDKGRILANAEPVAQKAAAIKPSLEATQPAAASNPLASLVATTAAAEPLPVATRILPDSFASVDQGGPPLEFTNSPLGTNLAHAFDATAAVAMDVDVTPVQSPAEEPMALVPEAGTTKVDKSEPSHLTDGLVTPTDTAHTTPPLAATSTETLISENALTSETDAIEALGAAELGAPQSVTMTETTVRTETVEDVTYPTDIQEPLASLSYQPPLAASGLPRISNVLVPESPIMETASVATTSTFPTTTTRDDLRAMDDSRSDNSVQVAVLESATANDGTEQRAVGQPPNRTYALNSTPVITEPWSTPSPAAWPINLAASPEPTQEPPPAFPDLATSTPENPTATKPTTVQEPVTQAGPGPEFGAGAVPPMASNFQRPPSPLPSTPMQATMGNGKMEVSSGNNAPPFGMGFAPTPDFRVENKLKQTIHSLVQQASDPTVTASDIRQRLFERLDDQYHTQAQSYLGQIDAWIDQALQAKVMIQDL